MLCAFSGLAAVALARRRAVRAAAAGLRQQLRREDRVNVTLLARLADGVLAPGPTALLTTTATAAAAHLVGTVLAATTVLLAAAAASAAVLLRRLPLRGGEAHLSDVEALLLQRCR